ncbi:MAG: DUF2608 domain-containing protein [Asticcacaulis sp.]
MPTTPCCWKPRACSPTQPDTAALVGDLQARHVAVYALSARGNLLRGATEAVLHDNGIDLSPAPECGPPLCTRRGNLADTQVRAAERRLGMTPPGPALP